MPRGMLRLMTWRFLLNPKTLTKVTVLLPPQASASSHSRPSAVEFSSSWTRENFPSFDITHSNMLSRSFRRISLIQGNFIPITLSHCIPKPQNDILFHRITSIFNSVSPLTSKRPNIVSFQVRSIVTVVDPAAKFDEMIIGPQRKYYFLGGKGGVGKTSCAASLAVKFADHGHPTIVISTDPAHSLSDSFCQDLAGGNLVPIEGLNSPLFALEINPEKTKEGFRSASQKDGGSAVKGFINNMGLGIVADQLGDLKLGELLDTAPPGLDEAIAISKVMQFVESPKYSMFSRIVFDTAPTGHTLRLLSLPDFLDASIGEIMKFKQKLASATSAIRSVLGKAEQQQDAPDKLQQLRERVTKVRDLFRDSSTTEFVIVTIPSVMAVNESSRLHASLKKECVPVRRLIVNQIIPPSASDCKFCNAKRKDQMRAMEMIRNDPELGKLRIIESPLVDLEIRGVPALKFMGDTIWK